MLIEIISDTVCPWCWIGKRRLERALAARPDLAAEVVWRPFQLNPDMPGDGEPWRAHLEAKFGDRVDMMVGTVAEVGAREGIAFDFAAIATMPNSLDSHRLVRWARTAGCQAALVESLFRRYFSEGQDISDHEVLCAAAAETGMDVALVRRLLADGADVERVTREDEMAREMGVRGVPAFIIDSRHVLIGAESAERWLALFAELDQAPDESDAPVCA